MKPHPLSLSKFWIFGPFFGVLTAIIVTLFVTTWEWIENPSGIFHGPDGTNWQFVFNTARSWFVPTLLNATILATALHLVWSGSKTLFKRFRKP